MSRGPLSGGCGESTVATDERIRQRYSEHPDSFLYASLPGAGPALEPRLLTAMGAHRSRYASAENVQTFSGIAPVTSRSGNTSLVCFCRACPKFVRQTFHEFAAHSIPRSVWARACYDQKRATGKSHHAAVRAVAFKWIRIIYACWRDRQPCDEQKYLEVLQRRNFPLTATPWQSIAGFQKLGATLSSRNSSDVSTSAPRATQRAWPGGMRLRPRAPATLRGR